MIRIVLEGIISIRKRGVTVGFEREYETDGETYENLRSLQQQITFVETAKEFSIRDIPFELNQQKSLRIMNTEGIYTNLGLLLSDQCPHTIKLAVFLGDSKSIFKTRREFTGSLLKQLNDAYEFIDLTNNMQATFEGLLRVDERDYPPEAVRETLLNTIVHRDYSFSASALISIFDNRMEFVSIGGLVRGITEEDIMTGMSISRNENLANVFYRLRLIEAYGTGITKIFAAYDPYNFSPTIEITPNVFKITLPNVHSYQDAAQSSMKLSQSEQALMRLFKGSDSISREEVQVSLAISQAMAIRLLRGLQDKGIVKRTGAGKRTQYIKS